jgi:hypothetical protein
VLPCVKRGGSPTVREGALFAMFTPSLTVGLLPRFGSTQSNIVYGTILLSFVLNPPVLKRYKKAVFGSCRLSRSNR